uniref:RBR-type E3 ubiquitin transferase n=1 Tax=Plectus sambesii TaxID=2011161 RepID=A0A914XRA5_9BILA
MASHESQMPSQENSDQDDSDVDDDNFDYYGEDQFEVAMYENRDDRPAGTSYRNADADPIDPEYFEYSCLQICDVERLLNECVEALCHAIPVTPALAKVLLHNHKWDVASLIRRYKDNCHLLLVETHIKPPKPVAPSSTGQRFTSCPVCVRSNLAYSELRGLACGDQFCRSCWVMHCASQLAQGASTAIECMEAKCSLLCPEDFVLKLLGDRPDLRAKYQHFVFQDHVKSHPELRFCPGADCPTVIRSKSLQAKRAVCKTCSTSFCFRCGIDYHAPTACATIKRWMIKCADDSETANYISAHTKDCPNCHACIEKNGGCNHMQCAKCKHHFCWMCFGDWKTHGSEYYECSRYKENPTVAQEAVHVKARRALEKYLHYYERVSLFLFIPLLLFMPSYLLSPPHFYLRLRNVFVRG